ncbi:unnamed protein product [Didymodactylos carnosus]|uniref:Uncharacterized protein n=1 Tax=Didymodactylos carnosus TaxID=1234261 RepID=A0A813S7I8_9BILA|nr:unnamed protein product [Didymodactylos carnosus]CAF0817738.1 unnamed protein product [Didymodactylos carnosus]CAF3580826.1 unnamed protein product [Didymodactylos carnosus]CAF3601843.1 unnamed protein product [Didymodactylos carnosus]
MMYCRYGVGNIHLTNEYPRDQDDNSIILSVSADEPIIVNKSYNYTSLLTEAILKTKIDVEKNFGKWIRKKYNEHRSSTTSPDITKWVSIFITLTMCGIIRKQRYVKLRPLYTNDYKHSESLPSTNDKHDKITALNRELIQAHDAIHE